MVMKTACVLLTGIGFDENTKTYEEGHQFGILDVDNEIPKIQISLDKTKKLNLETVNHPLLGMIPKYKAQIYDICEKAAELLIRRVEC